MHRRTFNGETRRIDIGTGQTAIDVKTDLYSDWKEWVLLEDNAKYLPAFSTTVGDEIGESQRAGDYYFLENGWKIKPQEADHVLTVTGNLFSRDGSSPLSRRTDLSAYRYGANTHPLRTRPAPPPPARGPF